MTAPAREGGADARSMRKPRRGDRLEVAVECFDAEGFGVGESDGLRQSRYTRLVYFPLTPGHGSVEPAGLGAAEISN